MTPEEQAFVERARVAALATVDGEGRPHAVPVCFALLERATATSADPEAVRRIVSAIDEKPKTSRDLRRVRNIRANPRVTLLVDRYREDWSRLAWVQVRGRARVLEADAADDERSVASIRDAAVDALESKYDQYADHDLAARPIISIRVDRTASWGALED